MTPAERLAEAIKGDLLPMADRIGTETGEEFRNSIRQLAANLNYWAVSMRRASFYWEMAELQEVAIDARLCADADEFDTVGVRSRLSKMLAGMEAKE